MVITAKALTNSPELPTTMLRRCRFRGASVPCCQWWA